MVPAKVGDDGRDPGRVQRVDAGRGVALDRGQHGNQEQGDAPEDAGQDARAQRLAPDLVELAQGLREVSGHDAVSELLSRRGRRSRSTGLSFAYGVAGGLHARPSRGAVRRYDERPRTSDAPTGRRPSSSILICLPWPVMDLQTSRPS